MYATTAAATLAFSFTSMALALPTEALPALNAIIERDGSNSTNASVPESTFDTNACYWHADSDVEVAWVILLENFSDSDAIQSALKGNSACNSYMEYAPYHVGTNKADLASVFYTSDFCTAYQMTKVIANAHGGFQLPCVPYKTTSENGAEPDTSDLLADIEMDGGEEADAGAVPKRSVTVAPSSGAEKTASPSGASAFRSATASALSAVSSPTGSAAAGTNGTQISAHGVQAPSVSQMAAKLSLSDPGSQTKDAVMKALNGPSNID